MLKSDKWTPMPRFLLRKAAFKKLVSNISFQDKQILEIGFGAGEMLRWFHAQGAKTTGVDFSPLALDMAKERLDIYGVLNDIKLYSNTELIEPSSIDVLCAFEVLEHIKDDVKTLDNWINLLKPQGSLIISVPAHMSKWNESDEWAGHYRRYEKKELIALFDNKNLRIEKIWNYGFPLSLLLDKLLGSNKRSEVENLDNGAEKEILSQKSGTERQNKLLYKIICNDWVLFPFYLIQQLFFRKDIGSGYLVHIKKT